MRRFDCHNHLLCRTIRTRVGCPFVPFPFSLVPGRLIDTHLWQTAPIHGSTPTAPCRRPFAAVVGRSWLLCRPLTTVEGYNRVPLQKSLDAFSVIPGERLPDITERARRTAAASGAGDGRCVSSVEALLARDGAGGRAASWLEEWGELLQSCYFSVTGDIYHIVLLLLLLR